MQIFKPRRNLRLLPVGKEFHDAEAVGGKIYVTGGSEIKGSVESGYTRTGYTSMMYSAYFVVVIRVI